ncbi:hypothetical protein LOCC1_G002053 [Lachnellula occidentalis]|uniref:Uncharacterized protein n=1 Tax=Lachnellula occidentalis TaxID=215460 RepID=A0A8H8S6T5_9HELO|nr:hypothetical protein LOCC1_G002053 [Lachnellula occidentalis]
MVYNSPFSSPANTPLQLQLIDFSTPSSNVRLEERGSPIRIVTLDHAPSVTRKTRFRRYHRAIWPAIFLIIGSLCFWAGNQKAQKKVSQELAPNIEGLQFIDVNHPGIRFVGRWTTTSDGARKEGSFPGVYFDFTFNGTGTVLLSLHNSNPSGNTVAIELPSDAPTLAFLPSTKSSSAEPISLLVRVDDNEYIVLPNATSIATIQNGKLDVHSRHSIRVTAPMIRENAVETLQVRGIYIDEGGQLLPCATSSQPALEESISPLEHGQANGENVTQPPEKMLEIVTDLPGSMAARDRRRNIGTARGILGGVMGWEYLLGEMFGIDHVMIGMDGMCLTQDCIGGRGSPAGLADVFFKSGPLGTEQYAHPWLFQAYTPDVMVLNIGNSDWDSFQVHGDRYNRTTWELSIAFEDTYIALVKAIRTLAYPKYSTTTVDSSRYVYSPTSAAAELPIFVMRPFRGQLEQATHAVVERLRREGDRSIFWLDTSGWLNTEVDFEGKAEEQDFFLDAKSETKQWRLTERGNQRVAILLHMHVCRYLARDAEKCAFLPPEVYLGKLLDPQIMRLDEFIEDERERRMKKLFWD